MDIGYPMGLGTSRHSMEQANFTVGLTGLSDNPTYGPCAQRGLAIEAVTAGWDGPVPGDLSYQWYGADQQPIAGATSASFVPDAPLVVETEIYCVVTAPGQGSLSTARVVFRDAPPDLVGTLFDEVFDLDTGPQLIASAAAFSGLNLQFEVTGALATIDPATGEITLPTDVARDGDIVTVTAVNSGGTATAAFQVTVEDVALDGVVPFGALTPAGAGGLPVTGAVITQGDPGGHWEIVNGMLVPTAAGEGALAGIYPLEFDTGDTLEVMIEAGHASARAEEIKAVYEALPLSAEGLLVQDGDARALGRIWLAPRQFQNTFVLEPTNWVEHADPRLSERPVTLAGLSLGGSEDGSAATHNVTVQGFVFQMQAGGLLPPEMQNLAGTLVETDGANGILAVDRPSRHVVFRQNEIWSRDLREIIIADDFRDNRATHRMLNAISTKQSSDHTAGANEHLRIEENWIHDCSRGVGMVATNSYQGVRSRLCNNIMQNCYSSFFTAGFLNGLDVFDNWCLGITASLTDTLGAYPQTSPHASVGGGFNASGSRSTQNVTVMGNLLHLGYDRTRIHVELGGAREDLETAATGMKFNDPGANDSYWNLVVAFNTIVSTGICIEMSGAGADDHLLVFNNTLARQTYVDGGSGPLIYFAWADNARVYNNIATGYRIGAEDGRSTWSRTYETLEGYGNITIANSGDFGTAGYFNGDATKGFDELTIEEALVAYTPKPTTAALMAGQKKGAQGTGLYQGNGVHTAVFAPPSSTANVPAPQTGVSFDGSTVLNWSGTTGDMVAANTTEVSLALWIKRQSDNQRQTIYDARNNGVLIDLFNNKIRVQGSNDSDFRFEVISSQTIPDDGAYHFVTMNIEEGRFIATMDGVLDPYINVDVGTAGDLRWRTNIAHIGRTYTSDPSRNLNAAVRFIYIDNVFRDMEDGAIYAAAHNADGSPRDPGSLGSGWFSERPDIFLAGTPTNFATNTGTGGNFTVSGALVAD